MRKLSILCGVLLIAGCSTPMYSLHDSNNVYPIEVTDDINIEQVREAILNGAKSAGWDTQIQEDNSIRASYRIRVHTIYVNITYTEEAFKVDYESSLSMKMACSHEDYQHDNYKLSGKEKCHQNLPPSYIHIKYKTWVDKLVNEIERLIWVR